MVSQWGRNRLAAISFEHADDARNALHAIVSDPVHGKDALSSPQTVSNLLQDLLPDAPRETSLLIAAANVGLPAALREHVALGMNVETAIGLVAATLAARTAFSRAACVWVATELAVALGLASPDVEAILPLEDEVGAGPVGASAGPGLTQIAQASPVQASPVQAGAVQADPAQTGTAQTGTAQTGIAQTGIAQTGTVQAGAVQVGAAPTAQVAADAWQRALGTDPAASPAGSDRTGPTTPIAAPPPAQPRDRRIIAAAVLVGCIVIAGAVIASAMFLGSNSHTNSPSQGASVPPQGASTPPASTSPASPSKSPSRSTSPSGTSAAGYHLTSTLNPHARGTMSQVAWTPDSSMVATSDKNGTTYLWNPAIGHLIRRFTAPGGAGQAFATAISPDGSTLAVGYSGGSTYLWNIASGNMIATLPDPGPSPATQVNSVAFSPSGRRLVSVDNNGNAFVWRVGSAHPGSIPIRRLSDPAGQGVWSATFSSNGTLATGDYAGNIYLWDIGSGSQVGSFAVPDGLNVTALAFSPDGNTLAAGSGTGTGSGSQGGLYLFSTSGQASQDVMNPGAVWALSFNGPTLAAADDDGQTYLFTVNEASLAATPGQTLADPNHGSQGVGAADFSPNGRWLVTGDTNGHAYVWSTG